MQLAANYCQAQVPNPWSLNPIQMQVSHVDMDIVEQFNIYKEGLMLNHAFALGLSLTLSTPF